MSDLHEVRRYWPRATARTSDELDRGQVGWREYAAGRASIRVDGDGAVVSRPLAFIWPVPPSPTIAAAMRAAGFGVRLLGIRAIYRRGPARVPLADHQRPRKGARLGAKKRREVGNA